MDVAQGAMGDELKAETYVGIAGVEAA